MKYAEIEDVELFICRTLLYVERVECCAYLEEAAAIIDTYNAQADPDRKKLVTLRMVRRQLDARNQDAVSYPTGATQGSASAFGYSQSWTVSGGSVGELYLSKLEKRMLGAGNRIGCCNPLEVLRQ